MAGNSVEIFSSEFLDGSSPFTASVYVCFCDAITESIFERIYYNIMIIIINWIMDGRGDAVVHLLRNSGLSEDSKDINWILFLFRDLLKNRKTFGI